MCIFKFYLFSTSLMKRFVQVFFVIIALYHIIITILGYWIFWEGSQSIISISRDALRIWFFLFMFFTNTKQIKEYLLKRKKVRIRFIVLIVFSIWVSFLNGKFLKDIMVGLKYGLYYLLIFLTASFIWFSGIKNFKLKDMHWYQWFLLWIVFFWFLRQSIKMARPEVFMNLWYWGFDDFYFWTNPPLYYLTWYEWTTRWQWIFSGPNNYAYFLIAFFPLVLLRRGNWLKKIKNLFQNPIWNLDLLYVLLRILAIIMTLSRSAIIWIALIIALLAKNWIKKNKKITIGILGIFILWIIGLSFLKKNSTINHINAKFSYIKEVVDKPFWHWLGSSGPAIHHNGNMLPENYFMQLMLDIWTVWFIIWCVVILQILLIFKWIKNIKPNDREKTKSWEINNELIYLHRNRLYLWRSVLLVIWLFLHVFEDSMVNYLFFVSFWILSWYLSKFIKKEKTNFKNLIMR